MFIGFNDLPVPADGKIGVVIAGAGPAGITLALELERRGIASLLLEGGGFRPGPVTKADIYEGVAAPRPYPLRSSRLRYFGGTSGHWGGWCRPLDEVDFRAIPGVPHSGWPIERAEAYRFLPQAHDVLEIPSADYESTDVMKAANAKALPLPAGSSFASAAYRFSPPTRFGTRYRAEIEKSVLVRCALNTNLVRVQRGDAGRTVFIVRGPDGQTKTIAPGSKVLAMGGIENARMLLWSNRGASRPLGGAGSDWIGRCFVDHFGMTAAKLLTRSDLDYGKRRTDKGELMPRIVPQRPLVAAGQTSNHMISLEASVDDSMLRSEYGLSAAMFGNQAGRFKSYTVLVVSGQRPNRDSRVTLGVERDANGVPRPILDWRIADEDFDAVLASVERLGRDVSVSGIGRLRKTDFRRRSPEESLTSGMHHLGTTRMASDPAGGVVDRHSKVFDTDNLYVAGSSVFPTSGYVNPTLTIVALAVRLADHLAGQSKRGVS